MALDVYGLLSDDTIADGVKFKVLENNGYGLRAREALMMLASGRYREHVYERFLRNPARSAVANNLTVPFAGKNLGSGERNAVGNAAADWTVPSDLESAGVMAGSALGPLGALAGGTIGGKLQGRSLAGSLAAAVPSALLMKAIPAGLRYAAASRLAKGTSALLEDRASNATGKLFKQLEVPRRGLRRYFGLQGQGRLSPAMQRAGDRLRGVRTQLTANPNMIVPVPMEMPDHTVQEIEMSYGQAQDMLDRYHQRGWSATQKARDRVLSKPIPGPPASNVYAQRAKVIQQRLNAYPNQQILVPIGPPGQTGNILAGPSAAQGVMQRYLNNAKIVPLQPSGAVLPPSDYNLAMRTRQNITKAINKNYGQGPANYYDSLTADYGTAAVLRDVFKKNVAPSDATLSHEALYQNASEPNVSSHLANTAGDNEMQQWMQEMFPEGESRIKPGKPLHVRLPTIPVIGPHIGVAVPAAPVAPPALTPGWPRAAGFLGSQAASQAIENLVGGPQTE